MSNSEKDLKIKVVKPFSQESDLVELVNTYSLSDSFSFYERMTSNREAEIEHSDLLNKNKEEYYVFLFNTWKNNLISITDKDFEFNGEYRYMGNDILPLISYLKKIPDAKCIADVQKCFEVTDDDLQILILRYGYRLACNGWSHIYSQHVSAGRKCHYGIESFFTINAKSYDTHKICRLFTKKCIKYNLPYYYKFNVSDDVCDNIVIYSDDEHLDSYLKVIEEIKNEFPNLMSRCGKPSILVGTINHIVGYGNNDQLSSKDYYTQRVKHLNEAITDLTSFFIKENYKSKINTEIGKVSIIDYLAYTISNNYINEVLNCIRDDKTCYKTFGVTLREFKSLEFLNFIKANVKSKLLKQFSRKKDTCDILDIAFLFGDNSYSCHISKREILIAIRECSRNIYKSIPHLYSSLKNYICTSASSYNISDIYCLNNEAESKKSYVKKES